MTLDEFLAGFDWTHDQIRALELIWSIRALKAMGAEFAVTVLGEGLKKYRADIQCNGKAAWDAVMERVSVLSK